MPANASKALPTEVHYWTTLTDDQLLGVAFSADDPTALDNVVLELPPREEIPTVEFAYDTKDSTGRKVRCVHCRYDNHNRGFVLRFKNGRRILVGKDCGKKIYGANFDLTERDFNAARERAGYIRRQRAIRAATPGFVQAMASLLAHPSLMDFRNLRRNFNRCLPELARLTADACCRSGGTMMVEEQVRDLEAEARREEQMDIHADRLAKMTTTARKRAIDNGSILRSGKKLKPIYRTIPKPVGQIEGAAFFVTTEDPPDEALKVLAPAMVGVLTKLDAERLTNSQYRSVFLEIARKLDDIEHEIERLEAPLAAFEFGNLSRLAEWGTRRAQDGDVYKAELGGITWKTPRRNELSAVYCPRDYRPPSRQAIRAFRAIVSGL